MDIYSLHDMHLATLCGIFRPTIWRLGSLRMSTTAATAAPSSMETSAYLTSGGTTSPLLGHHPDVLGGFGWVYNAEGQRGGTASAGVVSSNQSGGDSGPTIGVCKWARCHSVDVQLADLAV